MVVELIVSEVKDFEISLTGLLSLFDLCQRSL